jgi:hypothetical protein
MPLSFSDEQLQVLFSCATPLSSGQRQQFLAAIETEFAGRSEVGNGELRDACARLQQQFMVAVGVDGRLTPRHSRKLRAASV